MYSRESRETGIPAHPWGETVIFLEDFPVRNLWDQNRVALNAVWIRRGRPCKLEIYLLNCNFLSSLLSSEILDTSKKPATKHLKGGQKTLSNGNSHKMSKNNKVGLFIILTGQRQRQCLPPSIHFF